MKSTTELSIVNFITLLKRYVTFIIVANIKESDELVTFSMLRNLLI